MTTTEEFIGFPKLSRLRRECIITEKIDGTNSCVRITEGGQVIPGSRNRWISVADDNYGFAKWVEAHKDEILKLGVGLHFGEWWGSGVQRGYGLKNGDKRWSLFNTIRWCLSGETPRIISSENSEVEKWQEVLPECCGLVPVMYKGLFDTSHVDDCLDLLRTHGSLAAPGFAKPEGVVCFHMAANIGFKTTLDRDGMPKGKK